jgi:hypothetical protein
MPAAVALSGKPRADGRVALGDDLGGVLVIALAVDPGRPRITMVWSESAAPRPTAPTRAGRGRRSRRTSFRGLDPGQPDRLAAHVSRPRKPGEDPPHQLLVLIEDVRGAGIACGRGLVRLPELNPSLRIPQPREQAVRSRAECGATATPAARSCSTIAVKSATPRLIFQLLSGEPKAIRIGRQG